jgi:hypothetical protein
MKPIEEVRRELRDLASKKPVAEHTAEEAATAAMVAAVESGKATWSDPVALLREGREQLTRLRREQGRQTGRRRRTTNTISVQAKQQDPARREWHGAVRRSPKRTPRGTVVQGSAGAGMQVIAMGDGAMPDRATRLAAEVLIETLERVAAGESVGSGQLERIRELYEEVHGVRPEHNWVAIYVEELERACLQSLPAPPIPPEPSETSYLEMVKPKTRKVLERKPIRPVFVPSLPGRGVVHLFQEDKEGKKTWFGAMPVSQEEQFCYSGDPQQRAKEILWQVRIRTGLLENSQTMPNYADDPKLVSWLFERFGFAGRGGPMAVTAKTIKQWLADPALLADELEQHTARCVERGSEAEATELSDWARSVVVRLRGVSGAA